MGNPNLYHKQSSIHFRNKRQITYPPSTSFFLKTVAVSGHFGNHTCEGYLHNTGSSPLICRRGHSQKLEPDRPPLRPCRHALVLLPRHHSSPHRRRPRLCSARSTATPEPAHNRSILYPLVRPGRESTHGDGRIAGGRPAGREGIGGLFALFAHHFFGK
jgi:hypothetical protein